jgi:hypothetical protein
LPQVLDRLFVLQPIGYVLSNAGIGPPERHCLADRIIEGERTAQKEVWSSLVDLWSHNSQSVSLDDISINTMDSKSLREIERCRE